MINAIRLIGISTSIFFITISHAHIVSQVNTAINFNDGKPLVYEVIDEYAVVEGDILIGKANEINNHSAVITLKVGGTRWPDGVIPFEISEELPFQNKLAIFQAIEHWQKNTYIEFIELTLKNRSFYKDYISFIPATGTTCSSYVGKHGGQQVIKLAPRCNTMNTVHEIGHALGMWHEQSRADRDNYVKIIWENIKEEHKSNFNQHLQDSKDFGKYDYQSIMHYSARAFSKNGQKTIIPLMEGVEIGQRKHLSRKDIEAIKTMYPGV